MAAACTEPPGEQSSPTIFHDSVVLVGAGNIARCDEAYDEATARLLDSIPGVVFTTGDNVHASGSRDDYEQCFGPSWGRHVGRTRPAPGDAEYRTPGASPYYTYFGGASGDSTRGYYSYDLGGWHIVVLNSSAAIAGRSSPSPGRRLPTWDAGHVMFAEVVEAA